MTMLRGRVVFRRSAVRGALNVAALDEIMVSEGQGEWLPCGQPDLLGWQPEDGATWPNRHCPVLERADQLDAALTVARHAGTSSSTEGVAVGRTEAEGGSGSRKRRAD